MDTYDTLVILVTLITLVTLVTLNSLVTLVTFDTFDTLVTRPNSSFGGAKLASVGLCLNASKAERSNGGAKLNDSWAFISLVPAAAVILAPKSLVPIA